MTTITVLVCTASPNGRLPGGGPSVQPCRTIAVAICLKCSSGSMPADTAKLMPTRPALPHHRRGNLLEVLLRLHASRHREAHVHPSPIWRHPLVIARLEQEPARHVVQPCRPDDLPRRLHYLGHRPLVREWFSHVPPPSAAPLPDRCTPGRPES